MTTMLIAATMCLLGGEQVDVSRYVSATASLLELRVTLKPANSILVVYSPGYEAQGKVVGIVNRANLLQALASFDKQTEVSTPINDSKIREKVLTQLSAEPWTRPALINVIVQDGTVELWGIVDSASEKNAVRVAAEVTPGVRAVNDNLIIRPVGSGY
jgi:osmotically-inducible protein OsmY